MKISEPEDLKEIGFFGIYEEAFKIIISWRQIFIKITLFFILPLSFIFLANIQITRLIFAEILVDIALMMQGNPLPKSINEDSILSEFLGFLMFITGNNFLVLVISLLSTSAIVYTVACVYMNYTVDLTFSKVMNVVPQVIGHRLLITFLWNFIIQIGFHALYIILSIILIWSLVLLKSSYTISPRLAFFLVLAYVMAFTYINVLWHLSCVVSVLDEDHKLCGINAMKKSKELVKGKLWISCIMFMIFYSCLAIIQVYSLRLTDEKNGYSSSSTWRILFVKALIGILCLLLIMLVILVGLVTQCVVYFSCKSYHDETIDKTNLLNHLKVYDPKSYVQECGN